MSDHWTYQDEQKGGYMLYTFEGIPPNCAAYCEQNRDLECKPVMDSSCLGCKHCQVLDEEETDIMTKLLS